MQTHQIDHLLIKANSYLPKDPAVCLEQLQQVSSITDSNDNEYKGLYYLTEGKALINLGKLYDAQISINQALSLSGISEISLARIEMWQAYLSIKDNKINDAQERLEKCIRIFKTTDEPSYLTNALAFMGMALIRDSKFTDALNLLMESLDLATTHQLDESETRICSYISVIHYWLNDLEKAEKWLSRSYIISKRNGYVRLTIANRINSANISILRNQPKIAIQKLLEVEQLILNSGYEWNILLSATLNNIGNSYTHEKNLCPLKALEYHYRALQISESIKKKSSICHALLGISKALLSKDKAKYPFSSLYSKEWIEKKLANLKKLIGENDNLMLNKAVLETHTNFYKYLGDYEKAFNYLEKFMAYEEKYLKKEKMDSVKVLQIEYDLQQKELEFQKLELNQKQELEKINKSLEKNIAERTKDLTAKNEELQEYAHIVAHDLKEPIRSIVSFSQLLERKLKDKLNDDEKELMNFIKNSGINMGNLVQALLEYTTVNIDYKSLPEHNLNKIIDEVLRDMDYSIKNNNAEITVAPLPESIICDKVKIHQLFQNIISNAIKFKKKDHNIKINITCEKRGYIYLFSIQDNGIGIKKDYYENIFKLFKRLNQNDNYEGTGIGLSVSKKIVEQHGGEIWLDSTFNEGTTFYFTLPCDE